MALAVLATRLLCNQVADFQSLKAMNGLVIACGVPVGAITYIALLTLFRFKDMDELKKLIFRKVGKKEGMLL